MKLYLVCDANHEYVGLYDDRANAEKAQGNGYYYEFDLNDLQYFDDGAIRDIESY